MYVKKIYELGIYEDILDKLEFIRSFSHSSKLSKISFLMIVHFPECFFWYGHIKHFNPQHLPLLIKKDLDSMFKQYIYNIIFLFPVQETRFLNRWKLHHDLLLFQLIVVKKLLNNYHLMSQKTPLTYTNHLLNKLFIIWVYKIQNNTYI